MPSALFSRCSLEECSVWPRDDGGGVVAVVLPPSRRSTGVGLAETRSEPGPLCHQDRRVLTWCLVLGFLLCDICLRLCVHGSRDCLCTLTGCQALGEVLGKSRSGGLGPALGKFRAKAEAGLCIDEGSLPGPSSLTSGCLRSVS